jgi:hypothetical protein
MSDFDDLDPDFITYQPTFADYLVSSKGEADKTSIARQSLKDLSLELKRLDKNQRINFRIDAELKRQFEQLCQDNRTTVSAALKRMMVLSVKSKLLP